MAWYNWSQTAASNANADTSINWAEGQAPSSVNDSARAMMAATAKYRDDVAGAIVTGGISTAYTLSSFSNFDTLAHLNGQMIGFVPSATSTNAAGVDITLNVDSLGAKPVRMQPGLPMPSGTLILGTPYLCVYNNTDGAFYLQNMINPYSVPLGSGMDFWGSTAPNSSFAFPLGQQISQTTYAALYAVFGPNRYGTDAGGNFFLPDKTGRASVMIEASATRLTSTFFGGNSTVLGAVGGAESQTLTAGQIPTISSSAVNTISLGGSVPVTAGTPNTSAPQFAASSGGTFSIPGSSAGWGSESSLSPTISVTSTNTGGAAHRTVQPTICCNYIIRII